jgi:hypothetical protein
MSTPTTVSVRIKLERFAVVGFNKGQDKDGAVMTFTIDVPAKQANAVKRFFGGKKLAGLYAAKSVKVQRT